ncbi:MAG: hypothetical protein DWQ35_15090 [Planctomycetota bacterium]|nr:MAG: hypothetical protein DWQ35_15090 [Planctomycetota bacterium]
MNKPLEPTSTAAAADVEVFFGELTDSIARIYLRAGQLPEGVERIAGRVRGPRCEFARTLPSEAKFEACSDDGPWLASATLPDPCPWTPELPMIYDVTWELLDGRGEAVATVRRELGLRPLGARGTSLYLDGRRWVPRGARADSVEADGVVGGGRASEVPDVDTWREGHAVMLVDRPDDELAAVASRRGVLLMATVGGDSAGTPLTESALREELRRLAHWPAVAMVALASDAAVDDDLRRSVPNLLLAQLAAGEPAVKVESWADLVLCSGSAAEVVATKLDREVPLVALAPQRTFADVDAARSACDTWQGELAAHGDFAGYLV